MATHERLRQHALLWVGLVRLGLTVLPLRTLRRLLERTAGVESPEALPATPKAVGDAVRAAARAVPFSHCLVEALAAEAMLRRRGATSCLHLGVRREGERLGAHAWVEADGDVVVGAGPSGHAPLAPASSC